MNYKQLLVTFLIMQAIAVLLYTIMAFQTDGANIFAIFLSNIRSFTWNGQFNLDFSCYLALSALWIVWRNKFSASSFFIAIAAMIVGIMVFAPYVAWLIVKEKGNMQAVLTGER